MEKLGVRNHANILNVQDKVDYKFNLHWTNGLKLTQSHFKKGEIKNIVRVNFIYNHILVCFAVVSRKI